MMNRRAGRGDDEGSADEVANIMMVMKGDIKHTGTIAVILQHIQAIVDLLQVQIVFQLRTMILVQDAA